MHHTSPTPSLTAACGVAGILLISLAFLVSPLSVAQAAVRCPSNDYSKPCSLPAALETCEAQIDRFIATPNSIYKRCKIPGVYGCSWCRPVGSPPLYATMTYWSLLGTPHWRDVGRWWVGSDKPETRKNLGQPEFCPVGNPINQATGNKFQVETDYVSPVSGGLTLQRYYNSRTPTHGSLGTHWQSTYDRRLDTRYQESTLTMIRADGKHHVFWQSSAGGWRGEARCGAPPRGARL